MASAGQEEAVIDACKQGDASKLLQELTSLLSTGSNFKGASSTLSKALFAGEGNTSSGLKLVMEVLAQILQDPGFPQPFSSTACHLLLDAVPSSVSAHTHEANRTDAANLFESTCQAVGGHTSGARIVSKLASVFQLSYISLVNPQSIAAYVSKLLTDRSTLAPAGLDESMDRSACIAFMVAEGQDGLAEKWVTSLDKECQECIDNDRLKSASKAVRTFQLKSEFPDVEQPPKMLSAGEMALAEDTRKQFGLPDVILEYRLGGATVEERRRARASFCQLEVPLDGSSSRRSETFCQLEVPLDRVLFVDYRRRADSFCQLEVPLDPVLFVDSSGAGPYTGSGAGIGSTGTGAGSYTGSGGAGPGSIGPGSHTGDSGAGIGSTSPCPGPGPGSYTGSGGAGPGSIGPGLHTGDSGAGPYTGSGAGIASMLRSKLIIDPGVGLSMPYRGMVLSSLEEGEEKVPHTGGSGIGAASLSGGGGGGGGSGPGSKGAVTCSGGGGAGPYTGSGAGPGSNGAGSHTGGGGAGRNTGSGAGPGSNSTGTCSGGGGAGAVSYSAGGGSGGGAGPGSNGAGTCSAGGGAGPSSNGPGSHTSGGGGIASMLRSKLIIDPGVGLSLPYRGMVLSPLEEGEEKMDGPESREMSSCLERTDSLSILLVSKKSIRPGASIGPWSGDMLKDKSMFFGTDQLLSWDFDFTGMEEEELVKMCYDMFLLSNVVDHFSLDVKILSNFLSTAASSYHDVPYHNFNHVVHVVHAVWMLLQTTQAADMLTMEDHLALLVAAVLHDSDHDGYSNSYHVNSCSELANIYNDISVMENHHCAMAFAILRRNECALLNHLCSDVTKRLRKTIVAVIIDVTKRLRKTIVAVIMCTDITQHFMLTKDFQKHSNIIKQQNHS
eukprot:gene16595-22833_t